MISWKERKRIQEEQLLRSSLAAQTSRTFTGKLSNAASHPIVIALISFVLTGIAATLFSKQLDNLSKAHESAFAAQQRAIDSVKVITDLLYERRTRGVLVSSAMLRDAPIDEIKERKRAFDESYVKWNADIQSNMFRIREIFHTSNYTQFEAILENNVRPLLALQDSCLTSAFDAVVSTEPSSREKAKNILSDCVASAKPPVSIRHVGIVIQNCAYFYMDALYKITSSYQLSKKMGPPSGDSLRNVMEYCNVDQLEKPEVPVHKS